ncbi:MAG: protease modulator HflK [Planctomycetota bacterium]|jgi:regulator of protease activity HflC (stomatin/prohibitin superfamily)
MTEQNRKDNEGLQPQLSEQHAGDELDAAGKSLSEALRVSFIILKIIMIVLVIVFFASGFRTVGPDEQALVLRFGKIRGTGEDRILEPDLYWVFPYPIEKIVKIPVAKKVNLAIDSFWYYQRPEEMLPAGPKDRIRIVTKLDPERDGYCITRSEKQSRTTTRSAGSDYNIVHCKWQLIYQVGDPERFFKNVYVEDIKPGEIYFDAMEESVKPLLQSIVDDAIVTVMVNYTIDEVLFSKKGKISDDVSKLVQEKLDKIESGIKVDPIQLTYVTWPRQVNTAFWESIRASQAKQQAISEAITYYEKILNEAAGPVAEELLAVLEDETIAEEGRELLWSQVAGAAREEIAQARAYRIKVVETAKASAKYLEQILSEYRKHPKLVIQRIYLDAIEYVLNNADEKFIVQPTEGTKGREIRILLNRDPTIKPKSQEK